MSPHPDLTQAEPFTTRVGGSLGGWEPWGGGSLGGWEPGRGWEPGKGWSLGRGGAWEGVEPGRVGAWGLGGSLGGWGWGGWVHGGGAREGGCMVLPSTMPTLVLPRVVGGEAVCGLL